MSKILVFYSEIFPYFLERLEFIAGKGTEIKVFCWKDERCKTDFEYSGLLDVNYNYSHRTDLTKVLDFSPQTVYVSGWMDIEYLKTCYYLKRKTDCNIVVGFDDVWFGTVRQFIGAVISRIGFKQFFFTHAWVSGYPQYHYAKIFGFENIIFGLLTPTRKFYDYKAPTKQIEAKINLLYVGRLSVEKGVQRLINFCEHPLLKDKINLHIVGDGPMRDRVVKDYVIFHGYQNDDYILNLASSCHVGILLSDFEKWGVSLHEYCLLSLPVIISSVVGARENLVIHQVSGFVVDHGDVNIEECIKWLSTKLITEYSNISNKSRCLGESIPYSLGIDNLISL